MNGSCVSDRVTTNTILLRQNTLAVPLSRPDNRVGVMVDDYRNVLVSLFVTGLVDADINEVIKPLGTLWLYVIQRSVDAAAYRFPVDAHVL